MNSSDLIQQLKEIKEREKISYESIAREIGVTQQSVRNWMVGGRRPMPVMRKIIREFIERHGETNG